MSTAKYWKEYLLLLSKCNELLLLLLLLLLCIDLFSIYCRSLPNITPPEGFQGELARLQSEQRKKKIKPKKPRIEIESPENAIVFGVLGSYFQRTKRTNIPSVVIWDLISKGDPSEAEGKLQQFVKEEEQKLKQKHTGPDLPDVLWTGKVVTKIVNKYHARYRKPKKVSE